VVLGLVGIEAAAWAVFLTRLFTLSLLYVAFLHGWQIYAYCGPALRSVLWANALQGTLSAVLVMFGTLQGTLNVLGWLLGALFALVAILSALAARSLSREKIEA
jgi:hypothetical protein